MTTLNTASIKVSHGYIYITLVEEGYKFMPVKDQVMPIVDEDGHVGEVQYGISDAGVVAFGIWYEDKQQRPGHGGLWSSRAGVVSPMLDLPMVSVSINRMATHVTVPAMEAMLEAQGMGSAYNVLESYSGGETTYEVVAVPTTGFCHLHQEKLYGGESCYTCEDMAETEDMIMQDN